MPAISSDTASSGAHVVVSAAAHERLVAQVGPVSATAFLGIALAARPDERGVLVATTSARALARQVHVAKDTAAGILHVLVKRGHLRRLAQPRSGGRFAPARYVVRPPDGFVVSIPDEDGSSRPRPAPPDTVPGPTSQPTSVPPKPSAKRPGARSQIAGDASQLGLFSPASTVSDERTSR